MWSRKLRRHPYSDRPGQGWQAPHLPSEEGIRFLFGFAQRLFKPTLIYGCVFAFAAAVFGLSRLPSWGARALAAPVAFFTSGLMMAAAGWVIAISSLGVIVAAICGGLWGLLIFPPLVVAIPNRLPLAVRIALPILLSGSGVYLLIRPMLPDPALTNAKIELVRRDDAGAPISNLDFSYLEDNGLHSVVAQGKYAATNRLDLTTDDRNQVRVLLLMEDVKPVAHIFAIPRKDVAVFRQRHGRWLRERGEGKDSEIELVLRPGHRNAIDLELKGPCCSSMSRNFGPFR